MKRYNEVLEKSTEKVKKDLLEGREGKDEGLTRGYGKDGEDFSESDEGGLSEGEGEEGGDFMGDGKVQEEQNKMKVENEPEASAGKIETDPDYSKIETGTTGSNRNKDYIQEKKGPAEGELEDRSLEHRNPE